MFLCRHEATWTFLHTYARSLSCDDECWLTHMCFSPLLLSAVMPTTYQAMSLATRIGLSASRSSLTRTATTRASTTYVFRGSCVYQTPCSCSTRLACCHCRSLVLMNALNRSLRHGCAASDGLLWAPLSAFVTYTYARRHPCISPTPYAYKHTQQPCNQSMGTRTRMHLAYTLTLTHSQHIHTHAYKDTQIHFSITAWAPVRVCHDQRRDQAVRPRRGRHAHRARWVPGQLPQQEPPHPREALLCEQRSLRMCARAHV